MIILFIKHNFQNTVNNNMMNIIEIKINMIMTMMMKMMTKTKMKMKKNLFPSFQAVMMLLHIFVNKK